jgi:hypothetical protein
VPNQALGLMLRWRRILVTPSTTEIRDYCMTPISARD